MGISYERFGCCCVCGRGVGKRKKKRGRRTREKGDDVGRESRGRLYLPAEKRRKTLHIVDFVACSILFLGLSSHFYKLVRSQRKA